MTGLCVLASGQLEVQRPVEHEGVQGKVIGLWMRRVGVHLMETGIPIFRQVMVTIVVAENDTSIRLQIERSNPAILAPQLLVSAIKPYCGFWY